MKATPTKPACNVTLDPLIRGLVHDSFPRSGMAPGPETVSASLFWVYIGKLVSPAADTKSRACGRLRPPENHLTRESDATRSARVPPQKLFAVPFLPWQ